MLGAFILIKRKTDRKSSAHPHLASDFDFTFMGSYNLVRDCKPQTDASHSVFRCKIRIVNLLLNIFRNADTCIPNFKCYLSRSLICLIKRSSDIDTAALSALLVCCFAQD